MAGGVGRGRGLQADASGGGGGGGGELGPGRAPLLQFKCSGSKAAAVQGHAGPAQASPAKGSVTTRHRLGGQATGVWLVQAKGDGAAVTGLADDWLTAAPTAGMRAPHAQTPNSLRPPPSPS